MACALRELEDLRALLDAQSPGARSAPPRAGKGDTASYYSSSPPRARAHGREAVSRSFDAAGTGIHTYSDTLNATEENVERLNRAMEAAEQEMEAAFRRAGDIHRVQVQRRDHEVHELRRLLEAKDRALDDMRDTIASTKRALAAKLAQSESALAQRDSEILRAQDENKQLRAENRQLKERLEKEAARAQFSSQQLSRQEGNQATKLSELNGVLKLLTEDKSRLASKLQTEALEKEALQERLQTLGAEMDAWRAEHTTERETSRIELQTWKEKHKVEEEIRREYQQKYESEKAKRKLESMGHAKESVEIKELEKKLRSERRCRKASEKWLKAELSSREEMETLFMALRDLAISKDKHSDLGAEQIADLLAEQQQRQSCRRSLDRYVSPDRRRAPPPAPGQESYYYSPVPTASYSDGAASSLQAEYEMSRILLAEDNARLKRELQETRQLLTERLTTPSRSRGVNGRRL
mmetsp:Transcript_30513/g.86252  ORF Transcript_30513/g.86252 Transcript_30513/m.86252 type:complete len:468 (+) Transcript_30513:167-1570(+)